MAWHSSSLSCAGLDTLLLPHPPLWSLFSSKSSLPYPVLSTHPSLTTECSLQTSPVPTRGGSLMQASQHHTEGATWHLLPRTGPSDPSPPSLVLSLAAIHYGLPGHPPSCQIKTLGCRALGSTLVTATSTSRRVVFLISAISSLENSLSWKKPGVVGMGRGCQPQQSQTQGPR